jgi:hypothetical protein
MRLLLDTEVSRARGEGGEGMRIQNGLPCTKSWPKFGAARGQGF